MQDRLGIAEVKYKIAIYCCSPQATHFSVTITIDKYFDSSSVWQISKGRQQAPVINLRSARAHKQGSRVSKLYYRMFTDQVLNFLTVMAELRDSSNWFPQAQEERSLGRSVLGTPL